MAAAVRRRRAGRALPRTLDQLAEYHTIILGDVSPKMLDTAFVDLLVKAVRERGVGLIVEAGPLSMPHKFDDRARTLCCRFACKHGVAGKMPRGDAVVPHRAGAGRSSCTTPCGCTTT